MDQSKTKIWRGGLAAITGRGADEVPKPPQPSAATRAEARSAPKPGTPPAPDLAVTRPDRGIGPHTRIMGSAALPIKARRSLLSRELSTTRVMPIESLLPDAGRATQSKPIEAATALTTITTTPTAQHGSNPHREPSAVAIDLEPVHVPKRSLFSPKLVVPAFVVAILWLVASFFVNKPRPVATPEPAPPSSSARGIATLAAPVATPPLETPNAPSAPPGIVPRPAKLERAAVDALIAGDYAQAERLYAQLARSGETPNVFSEAGRILALRMRTKRL
ncbi:MAG TPA: hypothetical protein VGI70_16120 [Polyangiales bacterium]|jgi:hypothetical protein